METSLPNVFAAGDIIETKDINGQQTLLPTWPNAVNSGRIAGYNIRTPDLTEKALIPKPTVVGWR